MPCRSPGEGVCASQHALQVSRPTPREELEGSGWGVPRPTTRGGELRGLAWVVSRPILRGGLQAHTWGVGYPGPQLGGSPGPHPGWVYPSIH